MDIPLDDQIKCLERELKLRKRLFPKWVEAKKMTASQSTRELQSMEACLLTMKRLAWYYSKSRELRDDGTAVAKIVQSIVDEKG